MTCEIDNKEKCTMKLDLKDCTENDLANVLREIFFTAIKNKLVRPNILAQVLEDIICEYFKEFKSGLGA